MGSEKIENDFDVVRNRVVDQGDRLGSRHALSKVASEGGASFPNVWVLYLAILVDEHFLAGMLVTESEGRSSRNDVIMVHPPNIAKREGIGVCFVTNARASKGL